MRIFMRRTLFCLILLILTHRLLGQSNPVPFLGQPLVPVSAAPGSPALTLTINGSGFISSSVVHWNGTALTTTFVNASQLTASIPATDLTASGSTAVTVSNPTPGGGNSNSVTFAVQPPVSGTPVFTTFPQNSSSLGPAFPEAVGDFNGDGELDIAGVASTDGGTTTTISAFVALGNGDGSFQAPQLSPAGKASTASLAAPLIAADLNADGKLDLVVANSDDGTVSVLLGNGDGTFQTPTTYAVTGPTVVRAADFNRDGKLDLIVGSNQSGLVSVSLLLGNGDGTFQPHVDTLTGTTAVTAMDIADIDRDGNLDVVTADNINTSTGPHTMSVLEGNGNGTFKSPILSGATFAPNGNLVGILAADFNADGRVDLAIGVRGAVGNGTFFLTGNGDGTFGAPSQIVSLFGFLDGIGDFNGDGKLDIASGDLLSNGSTIGLGNGAGAFQIFGIEGPAPGVVGDFNHDGALDLATSTGSIPPDPSTIMKVQLQGTFQDFTVGLGGTSATVSAGKSADVSLFVAPVGGFSQSINLTCSGLPTGVSCSFTPASVTFSGTATQEVKLTFTGASSTASLTSSPSRFSSGVLATLLLAIVPAMVISFRKKRANGSGVSYFLGLGFLIVLGAAMSGCGGGGNGNGGGGGGGLTPGTSSVTVNASSALTPTITHAATITLTVH